MLGTLGSTILGNMLTTEGFVIAEKCVGRSGTRSDIDHMGQKHLLGLIF